MRIAYSSILAFRELVADAERRNGQRWKIYCAIRTLEEIGLTPSREDVAKKTGMRLSSVCGRVNEMIAEGLLERGPMKTQEVVPGKPTEVETLKAVVYRTANPKENLQPELFDAVEHNTH